MGISLDYLAGLVDADGCIYITKIKPGIRRRTVNPSYSPSLCVANTNLQLLTDLQSQFGGSVNHDSRGNCSRWTICSRKAEPLLVDLLPRLRIKFEQAWVCLELYNSNGKEKDSYSRITGNDEVARRECLYQRNKELNSGSYGKRNGEVQQG